MSQYIEKYKKNIVIDMRKKGYSYSEIQNSIHVPKSTVAYWLKDVKLTREQSKKLKIKQLNIAKSNSEKKKIKTGELIEEIKNKSAEDIKNISKRELWLMGIILYWRERLLLNNKTDFEKGINFTSSDPYLIKFFIMWLKDAGRIQDEEFLFDIFLYDLPAVKKSDARSLLLKKEQLAEAKEYWKDVTGFSEEYFGRVYYKKSNPALNSKKGTGVYGKSGKTVGTANKGKAQYGLLRIRVRGSSMLARQIAGWMKGISRYYWK